MEGSRRGYSLVTAVTTVLAMVAAELGLRAEKQQAASLQKELGLWGRLPVDEFEPCVREISLIRDIPAKGWKNL